MIDWDKWDKITEQIRAARARDQALTAQRETVLRAAAQTLPDSLACTVPLMYPAWDWRTCKRDMIVNYNGQLYRVLNTPTDDRPPNAEGMLAIYRPIMPEHAGTQTDPIPWVYGINCKTGLYYNCAERIWLCKSDMSPCTWMPGTAPTMWEVVT